MDRFSYIKNVNKVVIKVGTSTLAYESGRLNLNRIESLVRQIADLHNRGLKVVLVSSGAIGAGIGKLGLKSKPKTIPEKQAAAAVGQGILLHMYEKLFGEYGQVVGQVLLTRDDINDRVRFLNSRNVLFELLDKGVIPIINENDAVVVDEIKFGDNDTLSALVSSLIEADMLILLSDIDGLYDDNPRINPSAKLISCVDKVTNEIENTAGDAGTSLGTGGMFTKIQAAKIAVSSGTTMIIANGSKKDVIKRVFDGVDEGTMFMPIDKPLQARKRWIAFSAESKGKLILDDGAATAIESGNSLLASGVRDVIGKFTEGQAVTICNLEGNELGKGLINYNSDEINSIKGMQSKEIQSKLLHKYYDEVVHRDNMVVFKSLEE